jgi:small-conductance mechanosensitive channel
MNWNIEDDRIWIFPLILAGCLVLALLTKTILYFSLKHLKQISEKTLTQWDDLFVAILSKTKIWVIFFWCVHFAFSFVELPPAFASKLRFTVVFVTALQAVFWGLAAIRSWSKNYLQEKVESDQSSTAAIGLLSTAIQAGFIVVVLLFALSNLGIDIMALVAGLGVGGIAVALAAQNILGDLLASLSIVLDKPFLIGDFIVVEDKSGTVENIGIKTTRVRSLSGEQVVFSNKDLLENRVQNFKRMWERRVVQKVGVVYSTPLEQIALIPKWIREFIEKDPELRFDRCHLSGFGDSSLDFEFVFYVKSNEYNVFMDHQQTLLFDILKKFEEEKISIAFPSKSLYIETLPEQLEKRT